MNKELFYSGRAYVPTPQERIFDSIGKTAELTSAAGLYAIAIVAATAITLVEGTMQGAKIIFNRLTQVKKPHNNNIDTRTYRPHTLFRPTPGTSSMLGKD